MAMRSMCERASVSVYVVCFFVSVYKCLRSTTAGRYHENYFISALFCYCIIVNAGYRLSVYPSPSRGLYLPK